MSVQPADGADSRVERWLLGLGERSTVAEPEAYTLPGDPLPRQTSGSEFKCPVCEAPREDYGADRDRYDEDYDYYFGGIRMPLWIALIWQVPWRQRLDIFVIGFIVGMVIAALGLLYGLVLARY